MKYECEVVRDLLPIYIDGETSKQSSEIVEEHIKECNSCKMYYEAMTQSDLTIPQTQTVYNQNIVDFGKTIKRKRRKIFIVVASVIAFLLAAIVFMGYLIVFGGSPIKRSNVEGYGNFKGFKGYSNLYIFPNELPQSAVIEDYNYYYQDTLFDPTCQIFLEYSLSSEEFEQEVLRLSNISETYQNKYYNGIENKIVYDTDNFNYPAYVTIFKNNRCYEYALINEAEHKIICVFVQFIKSKDINFDEEYLPFGYEECIDEDGYSIYYSSLSTGYFERHNR